MDLNGSVEKKERQKRRETEVLKERKHKIRKGKQKRIVDGAKMLKKTTGDLGLGRTRRTMNA